MIPSNPPYDSLLASIASNNLFQLESPNSNDFNFADATSSSVNAVVSNAFEPLYKDMNLIHVVLLVDNVYEITNNHIAYNI